MSLDCTPIALPHFARPEQNVRKGFYIARRRNWRPDASWAVVMVMPDEDVPGRFNVHQPGSPRVDDPTDWIFAAQIAGLESLPKPGLLH